MKKNIFVFVGLFFLGFNLFAQTEGDVIGEVKDGKCIITTNLDEVLTRWNEILVIEKIDATLTTLEIVEKTDEESGEIYYILIAYNSDKLTKVACLIYLNTGGGGLLSWGSSGYSKTVTCTGCTVGCSPEYMSKVKMWSCKFPCGNECVKSETVAY